MAGGRILLLALLLAVTWSTGSAQECSLVGNCSGCVRTPRCVWCADLDLSDAVTSRCQTGPMISSCAEVENPEGRVTGQQFVDDPLLEPVNPRAVNVSLRTGVPQSFTVNVTALRNLPLDLYLLMDLSGSMLTDLTEVKSVAGQIVDDISSVTTNVRLGFGSFNEKVTRPFAAFNEEDPPDQCDLDGFECPPYAFRHQISLTDNELDFQARLQLVNVTFNVDDPENGLEAMAQVITCEDIIGWRSRSGQGADRGLIRVILYITDDHFHYAGEGQLAGIIEPYDGTCLLEPPAMPGDTVDFTAWDVVDYPSVGQIALLALNFEVVPIFAARESFRQTYEALADLINRKYRAASAVLAEDSSNITILIRDEVAAILQAISLIPSVRADLDITASVVATCPALATEVDDACQNVPLEETASFEVTVTLNSCYNPETGELLQGPIPYGVNIPTFGDFTIYITPLCDCGCEADSEFNSSMCSFNGNFTCGVCQCFPGSCGTNCSTNIGDRAAQECPRGGIDDEICSGRGTCECTCQCATGSEALSDQLAVLTPAQRALVTNPITFGDACECDNFRCPIDENGNVCGGATRGRCCENRCMCLNSDSGRPYTGSNCECLPDDQACLDPMNNTALCNGRGTCGCNQCECDLLRVGQFCDMPRDFSTCPVAEEVCILCSKNNEVCTGCPGAFYPIEPVRLRDFDGAVSEVSDMDQVMAAIETFTNGVRDDGSTYSFITECTFDDDEGCEHEYYVLRNEVTFVLLSISERSCPGTGLNISIPVWALGLIILGALLLIGILILIIVKIIFLFLDYQEVKRWQKEARDADFSKNQNPLYLSPESKFENVAYGRPM